jgi:hypothetical protein
MSAESTNGELGWCVLELMGHRRLAGFLTEQEIAGQGLIRIDVYPGDAETAVASQLYSPSAVYCITPTSEETARAVAQMSQPRPVERWELPPARDEAERPMTFDEAEEPGF